MRSLILGNLRRAWYVYLVLVLVVIGGTWQLSRQPRVQSPILPAAMVRMEPTVELQFNDVVMQGREKGTVRWRITAPRVSASQNQQYIYFERDPKGSFYNLKDWSPKDGAPPRNRTMDWTAHRAEYDSLMDQMTITGSASFVSEDQDTLKTEKLIYRARQHQLEVPVAVQLTTHDQLKLSARTATADTEMESVSLAGNVEVISPLKGKEAPL